MKIIVDADAAPRQVLEICKQAAVEYNVELWTVASFNHIIEWKNHIVVGDGPQETDMKVLLMAENGDIVVTQDFGLAAILLAKEVSVISPMGKIFRADTIEFLLEERDLKAKYRRRGGRTIGPPKRKEEDNTVFMRKLYSLLEQLTPGC